MTLFLRRIIPILCVACAGTLLAETCQAGSLWAKGTRRTRILQSDDVASEVGDVLTIVVNEKSSVETKTKRNDEKKTDRNIDVKGGVVNTGSFGHKTVALPQASFSSASDTKFDGKAEYGSDRTITDLITVTVQDVLPNGNLVVVGTRTREVAGDKQCIEVSGIVRPSDVTFANTVDSDRVADFHIVHKTKGQDSTYVRPGWLTRFGNIFNPF